MSKQNLEKNLLLELEIVNDLIDTKIIKGMSYAREARRHKFLLSSLARVRQASHVSAGWFAQSFSTVSSFLL